LLIITVGTFTAMSRACMLSFRLPESLNRLADRLLLLTPGTVPSQDGLRGVLDRAPCPLPVCCAMCPPLSAYGVQSLRRMPESASGAAPIWAWEEHVSAVSVGRSRTCVSTMGRRDRR